MSDELDPEASASPQARASGARGSRGRGEEPAREALLAERYGWRDPAQHEWTAGDIAFGWAVGCGVVLAGSLVAGVVLAGAGAAIVLIFGAMLGLPALTFYGVPVAIAAAAALRRVHREGVHLAVFTALGALGGLLTGLAAAGQLGSGPYVVAPMTIVGAATALTARALAHDRAVRSRGR